MSAGLTESSQPTIATDYEGGCMCGSVRFKYTFSAASKPVFAAYCHCSNCRKGASTSVAHLIGVPAPAFTITKGEEKLKQFSPDSGAAGNYFRKFCTDCGAGVCQGLIGAPFFGTFVTSYDFISAFPENSRMPAIPKEFLPTEHYNMENSLMGDVVQGDGLPKFKDFPAPFGSGVMWTPKL